MIGARSEPEPFIERFRPRIGPVRLDSNHGGPPWPNGAAAINEDLDQLSRKATAPKFRLHVEFVDRTDFTAEFIRPERDKQAISTMPARRLQHGDSAAKRVHQDLPQGPLHHGSIERHGFAGVFRVEAFIHLDDAVEVLCIGEAPTWTRGYSLNVGFVAARVATGMLQRPQSGHRGGASSPLRRMRR